MRDVVLAAVEKWRMIRRQGQRDSLHRALAQVQTTLNELVDRVGSLRALPSDNAGANTYLAVPVICSCPGLAKSRGASDVSTPGIETGIFRMEDDGSAVVSACTHPSPGPWRVGPSVRSRGPDLVQSSPVAKPVDASARVETELAKGTRKTAHDSAGLALVLDLTREDLGGGTPRRVDSFD